MAKLFEEIKVMFRDLPEKVEGRVHETIVRRRHRNRRMFHPMMLEEIMFHPAVHESPDGEAAAWLMLGSTMADEAPWFHELAMEMYRALSSKNAERIAAARDAARRTVRAVSESKPFHHLMREEDPDTHMMMRHLPEMLEHLLARTDSGPSSEQSTSKGKRRGKGDESA